MIAIGQRVPDATLYEFFETESEGCVLGPNAFSVAELVKGRKIVVFGLPGAFTPTCSAKHVPSYLKEYDALRAAGVDEIWCHSVNDAFVMGAWGREQKATGKVRMMGDGAAQWARALGLDQDLSQRGLGVRAKRYAMVVDDGVVTHLFIEEPGEFKVSSAEWVLQALRA
ncbi:glutaredoxin/glutathione-dependent peroxiredoxin [Cupriavidus metallidurans]|jgi:peroxiredoxin|uniref:Glutathione-dependent peroxiredoxin n=1 Tax=Cupriavidus metallidurans (strain ATCC 43123 / DSM 2839 / NBRC 102507 / CH34) TaxID=266264 RepID=Q1LIN2_CUPMC|nr:peroxiredoxin [Cupriavidus metallidurans]ABF09994.1 Peroxiredoxin [Cupriavidus metallidurans CH34]KWW33280.1 putative peroxiredoxin [Cupriavidus metallidurans]MDE4919462.1 peroxiredoxin [Cupriavidus metallidurans]QGS29196.1 redoxin family protein [Cupriavidus metallidurans]UBM10575.1 peroxiredoxin [Cupriavidus metallidurans]